MATSEPPKIRNRIVGLRTVAASELVAHPLNWRRHPQAQRDALLGVLGEVGIVDVPICRELPDGRLQLLDGHLRSEVLGESEIPVLVIDVGDDSEAAKILATLDPLAAMAEVSAAQLDQVLRLVDTGSNAVQEMLAELADTAGLYREDKPEVTEDEVPELPIEAITKPGDLWLLGDHRLLCGDAADPRDIARLLAGETPGLTIVDPPYEMLDSVWSVWIADPSIVFGQMRQMRMIPAKWWRFERVIVKRYRHRSATVQIDHRHAFVAQVGSDRVLPHTSETFPSVLEQEADIEHDHQKPLGLLIEHMTQWTPPWKMVLDPFLGSGTTLIAAEQLGRKCYGMEISPQYVSVILDRWAKLTGRDPVLETTAQSWADMKANGRSK